MHAETAVVEKKKSSKLFVLSVVFPFLATFMANGILILLLKDITVTFFGSATPSTLGLAGQLSMYNSLAEAVAALFIGFLAIRFRHKPLFIVGVLCIAIAAAGNFLAPSFNVMVAFFALEGIGSVIITVVGLSLIGDFVPAKNKSKAVSYTLFSFYLSSIIGPPLVGLLTSMAGWRYAFLLYALPIAIIALVIAQVGIPKKLPMEKVSALKVDFVASFKSVLLNRSAVFCLLAQLLLLGSVVGMYVMTFYQLNFGIDTTQGVLILMASGGTIGLGGLFAGRIIDRFGKKRTTITFFLLDAIALFAIFQTTDLWSGLIANTIHVFFIGGGLASLNCLSLDQIPEARSTMMSMTSVFGKLGNTIAASIASFLLLTFSSFTIMGVAFTLMAFITAITLLFTKEPKQ
ncbi:MAG: MFS transporter [Candidatus Bathyarchaeia archaeon]|jgi:predicted MFS family arabinose efflux permease